MKATGNNRDSFEEAWKSAFENKEKRPPSHIWDKVEVELSNNENNRLRRSLLFFKLMAAASILFAFGVVTRYWMHSQQIEDRNLMTNSTVSDKRIGSYQPSFLPGNKNGIGKQNAVASNGLNDQSKNEVDRSANSSVSTVDKELVAAVDDYNKVSNSKQHNKENSRSADKVLQQQGKGASNSILEGNNSSEAVNSSGVADLSRSYESVNYLTSINKKPESELELPDMSRAHMYMFPVFPPGYNDRKAEGEPIFVAALDVGVGQFETGESGGRAVDLFSALNNADVKSSQDYALNNSQINIEEASVDDEDLNSLSSYVVGMGAGYQLSRRWMLFSGLQYRKAETERQSAVYEFLNVPLSMGYVLKEGKFSIMLKAGVANEWLVSAKVKDNDRLTSLNLRNDDSPFNIYMVSGLVGTTFGYNIADHYMVSLAPGFQQAITSFTNENYSGEENKPKSLIVAFGLTYIFN